MDIAIGYTEKKKGFTPEQMEATRRMINSIGYDPEERVYYIDKTFNNLSFRKRSFYLVEVENYVRRKMYSRHFGYFKRYEIIPKKKEKQQQIHISKPKKKMAC
jgi:hypothetical protein